jgi:hypothetical protein
MEAMFYRKRAWRLGIYDECIGHDMSERKRKYIMMARTDRPFSDDTI